MVWIERKLHLFQATAAVCAVIAAGLVLWFNVPPGRAIILTRMKLGAVALPWLVGMVAFAPVIYVSWSRRVMSQPQRLRILVFVAVYLAVLLAVFGGFYGGYVFQLF